MPRFPQSPLQICLLMLCLVTVAGLSASPAARLRAADAAAPALELRLLGTGEIHATPDACDCPLNPVGGLARLAGLLKAEVAKAHDRTLLLDTGAWAAGGPMDSRSAGPAADRERSRWMLDFLHACPYAAVALGDEELALGKGFFRNPDLLKAAAHQPAENRPPLTCANLDLTPAERTELGIADHIEIKTAGHLYWIVALAPPGTYAGGDDTFVATDPEPALKACLDRAAADKTHLPKILLLSHLGDAATDALLSKLYHPPGMIGDVPDAGTPIQAVFAGHHRPAEVRQSLADLPILYVRGEGQYVSEIAFEAGVSFPHLNELPVDEKSPSDPAAAKLADQIRALISTARPQVDIFFATDCPHCTAALEPVLKVLARLEPPPPARATPPPPTPPTPPTGPLADVHLRFMVHRLADGRWLTGIQPGLAAETKSYEATRRLLIVQKYDPARVWPLLRWLKNNPDADFAEGLKLVQFPAWRMQGALDNHEDEPLLEENRMLTEQRNVPGTPAIYIQGKIFEGAARELPLMSALCAQFRARGDADADLATPCTGIPRCVQDGDCFKPGFISHCLDAGKPEAQCQFIEDKAVTVEVVQDPTAVHSNASELITQLGKFFAKLKVEAVDSRTPAGQAIIAAAKQDTLPVYVVKNLSDAVNQAQVEKFGHYAGASFILEPLPWFSHDHFQRERLPGRIDVFYQVHSPNAAKAIQRLVTTLNMVHAQQSQTLPPQVVLHPLIYLQATDGETTAPGLPAKLIAHGGLGELQQSALLACVQQTAPDRALQYASLLAEAPGSIYWAQPLQTIGLSPEAIATAARGDATTAALRADAKLAADLQIQGDIAFLVRNQELVPIQNGQEMYRVLNVLAAEQPPAPDHRSGAPPQAPTP